MILRNLVTRFSFETDQRGVEKFNKTLSGMRSGLKGFLGALGIGIGAREIYNLGKTTQQAASDLQRLAGTDFGKFQAQLSRIRYELNTIRRGAGGLVRRKVFNTLATDFVREFGTGPKQIDTFKKLFEAAALQSGVSGKSVAELFSGYMETLKGGGLDSLRGLPGFNINKQKQLEFILNTTNPGEPGGAIGREQRRKMLLDVLSTAKGAQEQNLKKLNPSLFNMALLARRTQDSADQLSEAANNAAAPVADVANKAASAVAKQITDVHKHGFLHSLREMFSGKGPVANFINESARKQQGLTPEEYQKKFHSAVKTLHEISKPLQLPEDAATRRARDIARFAGQPSGSQTGNKIEQHVTVHAPITVKESKDPAATGKAVRRELNKIIKDSRKQIDRTEND